MKNKNIVIRVIIVFLLALTIFSVKDRFVVYGSGSSSSNHGKGTKMDYDETYHWYKCKCGSSSCKKRYTAKGTEVEYGNTHSYSPSKAATCTEKGKESCACGSTRAIDMIDHNYGNFEYKNDDAHVKKCTMCGKEGESGAHSFNPDEFKYHVCTVCGERMKDKYYKHAFDSQGNCIYSGTCGAKIKLKPDSFSQWIENGEHYNSYRVSDADKEWTETVLTNDTAEFAWTHPAYISMDKGQTDVATLYITVEGEEYSRHTGEKTSGLAEDYNNIEYKKNALSLFDNTLPGLLKAIGAVMNEDSIAQYNNLPDILSMNLGENPAILAAWDKINDVKEYKKDGEDTGGFDDAKAIVSGFLSVSGRLRIQKIYLKNSSHNEIDSYTYSDGGRLFIKPGTKVPDPVKYLGYFSIGYRDSDGNEIVGAPLDTSKVGLIYYDGTYYDANFSGSPDLDTMDKLGWRYRGYKITNNTKIGGAISKDNDNDLTKVGKQAENYNVTCKMAKGQIFKSITFYFDPVKVTVKHVNRDRATINTNKNVEYYLPKVASESGHTCSSLSCESTEITDDHHFKGTTYTLHHNTSMSKLFFPGYILTNYTLTSSDGKNSHETKYITSEAPTIDKYDGYTTYVPKANELNGQPVPVEMYRKDIRIQSDFTVLENSTSYKFSYERGYKPDLELTFYYENVEVTVEHKGLKTDDLGNIINGSEYLMKSGIYDLGYIQILNGHFFEVSSLVTVGDQHMQIIGARQLNNNPFPTGGIPYNISGHILKRIELRIRGQEKVVWNKKFDFDQREGEDPEKAQSVVTALYYVINDSTFLDEDMDLYNEIHRVGNDLKFTFYYVPSPLLFVEHRDESRNSIYAADPPLLLNIAGTIAKSKENAYKDRIYYYKEYYLTSDKDMKALELGNEATQPDPNSDVRQVKVNRIDSNTNRKIVFVYKQEYPILNVVYIDRKTGQKIANDKDPIKMVTKSVDEYAIDIKDYNYCGFELYDGATTSSGLTLEGEASNVTVQTTDKDRLLRFIYDKDGVERPLDPTPANSQQIILKSNDRDNEEYNVAKAVPTSEDLYANVITDSFLLSNAISQDEGEANIHLTLVKKFDLENNEGVTNNVIYMKSNEILIPSSDFNYTYTSAKNVQLDIINRAVVKNDAIVWRDENGNVIREGEVELEPNYGNKPQLHYTQGGELVFHDLRKEYFDKDLNKFIKRNSELPNNSYREEGFYNVRHEAGSKDYYVEYLLPEDAYNITGEDLDGLMQQAADEYSSYTGLFTKACENSKVGVLMDYLAVQREDGSMVVVYSGKELILNKEYTLANLEKDEFINLHPKAIMINRDVLYKNDEIYVAKNKSNQDYDTTCDVYYIAHQWVNDNHEVYPQADAYGNTACDDRERRHDIFIAAGFYDVSKPSDWVSNMEILIDEKTDIVGNKVFVHTPVVNNTMLVQSNKVQSHIKQVFTGANNIEVNNANDNEYTVYTYDGNSEDIAKLSRQISGIVPAGSINRLNSSDVNSILQTKEFEWNGGVTVIRDYATETNGEAKAILMLGSDFYIFIPHEGTHISEKGYGRNTYNYKGLEANGDDWVTSGRKLRSDKEKNDTFAWKKQIKFSFDVIAEDQNGNQSLYKKDLWYDLDNSLELFKFTVLETNMELWKNNKAHAIDTRVIAENVAQSVKRDTTIDYPEISEPFANKEMKAETVGDIVNYKSNYIATNHINVRIVGDLRDLEIRATSDLDWTHLTGSLIDLPIEVTSDELPIGQTKQNRNSAYPYAVKLGDAVYFDIATNGWYGDTSDKINITPKYYFIDKSDARRPNIAREVDLYYKQSANGPYVNIKNSPYGLSTVMSADANKGSEFKSTIVFDKLLSFNNNAQKEFSTTDNVRKINDPGFNPLYTKWINTYRGGAVNYSNVINIGNTASITLPYNTRLAYSSNLDLLVGLNSSTKYRVDRANTIANGIKGLDYCIGHWYGAFELPSSTVAVEPGKDPNTDPLKDGYIIVGFDDIKTVSDGDPYLKYEPIKLTFSLPDNKEGELPDPVIPTVIYELIPNSVKFTETMTH